VPQGAAYLLGLQTYEQVLKENNFFLNTVATIPINIEYKAWFAVINLNHQFCHDRVCRPREFAGYYSVGYRVGSRRHDSSGDASRNLCKLGCCLVLFSGQNSRISNRKLAPPVAMTGIMIMLEKRFKVFHLLSHHQNSGHNLGYVALVGLPP